MGKIFSRKKDRKKGRKKGRYIGVIVSARIVQKLSPFDYKSSKFSGAWHNDCRCWRDKPSRDILPASVLSKLDVNPTLRYCKALKWDRSGAFEVRASVANVPRGIYEACVRMGRTSYDMFHGETSVISEVYTKEDRSDRVSKVEIKYNVSKEFSQPVPKMVFVEVCLGRLVLTESITQRVRLYLFDYQHKPGVYLESFGLRRINLKSSIAVLTLFLCLNRLSSCPGDDNSVSIASRSLYNAAPRARMLIDAFCPDKHPEFQVRVLET